MLDSTNGENIENMLRSGVNLFGRPQLIRPSQIRVLVDGKFYGRELPIPPEDLNQINDEVTEQILGPLSLSEIMKLPMFQFDAWGESSPITKKLLEGQKTPQSQCFTGQVARVLFERQPIWNGCFRILLRSLCSRTTQASSEATLVRIKEAFVMLWNELMVSLPVIERIVESLLCVDTWSGSTFELLTILPEFLRVYIAFVRNIAEVFPMDGGVFRSYDEVVLHFVIIRLSIAAIKVVRWGCRKLELMGSLQSRLLLMFRRYFPRFVLVYAESVVALPSSQRCPEVKFAIASGIPAEIATLSVTEERWQFHLDVALLLLRESQGSPVVSLSEELQIEHMGMIDTVTQWRDGVRRDFGSRLITNEDAREPTVLSLVAKWIRQATLSAEGALLGGKNAAICGVPADYLLRYFGVLFHGMVDGVTDDLRPWKLILECFELHKVSVQRCAIKKKFLGLVESKQWQFGALTANTHGVAVCYAVTLPLATALKTAKNTLWRWVVSEGEIIFCNCERVDADFFERCRDFAQLCGMTSIHHPDGVAVALEHCREWYQLLLGGMEHCLPASPETVVTIVPFGAMFGIPFGVLMDDSGAFFIEKHPYVVQTSLEMVELTQQLQIRAQALRERIEHDVDVVICACPSSSDLPFSHGECRMIVDVVSPHVSVILSHDLLRPKLVKETISECRPRIVHFAVHSSDAQSGKLPWFVDERATVDGSIQMTGDSLSVSEISESWDLFGTELVFFNGCKTGGGQIAVFDGNLGFYTSCFVAGCPSVVCILWTIPDVVARLIADEFYSCLLRGGVKSKAQCLRCALLKLTSQVQILGCPAGSIRSLLSVWAGYQLYGCDESVTSASTVTSSAANAGRM